MAKRKVAKSKSSLKGNKIRHPPGCQCGRSQCPQQPKSRLWGRGEEADQPAKKWHREVDVLINDARQAELFTAEDMAVTINVRD